MSALSPCSCPRPLPPGTAHQPPTSPRSPALPVIPHTAARGIHLGAGPGLQPGAKPQPHPARWPPSPRPSPPAPGPGLLLSPPLPRSSPRLFRRLSPSHRSALPSPSRTEQPTTQDPVFAARRFFLCGTQYHRDHTGPVHGLYSSCSVLPVTRMMCAMYVCSE